MGGIGRADRPAAAERKEIVEGIHRLRLVRVLPYVEYADGAVVVCARNLLFGVENAGHGELHVALSAAEKHVPKQHVRQGGSLARG